MGRFDLSEIKKLGADFFRWSMVILSAHYVIQSIIN